MWIWPDLPHMLSWDTWKKLCWQHIPSPKETKEMHPSKARAPAHPGNASRQEADTAHPRKLHPRMSTHHKSSPSS